MTLRQRFNSEHPGVFFLDVEDLAGAGNYLKFLHWIDAAEHVTSAEPAGGGNMNCTVRIRTTRQQFILKQSRPWVEKYPSISAPWNRALVEGSFYEWARSQSGLSGFVPKMLGFDPPARLLMLEDLGTGGDYTSLYGSDQLDGATLTSLLEFLSRLHSASSGSTIGEPFSNREMRRLNHEHIFVLPLRKNNGLDLDAITPGLKAAADTLINDARYCDIVDRLGQLYLSDGRTLVHGDYFPGSWLKSNNGVKIVDPEFCFCGAAEFDAGCMLAHLLLARQPETVIHRTEEHFRSAGLTMRLANGFAGTEIMRRLLGVAQLPLDYGIEVKRTLLDRSHAMISAAA